MDLYLDIFEAPYMGEPIQEMSSEMYLAVTNTGYLKYRERSGSKAVDKSEREKKNLKKKEISKNNHPRDSDIVFIEETHTYLIKNLSENYQKLIISVTSLIQTMFDPFDADEAIRKMKGGRNWDRQNKCWDKTNDEIKAMWNDIKVTAAEKGTKMHEFLENYFDTIIFVQNNPDVERIQDFFDPEHPLVLKEQHWPDCDSDLIDKSQFYEFLRGHSHLKPFYAEKRLFSRQLLLAGTVDILFEELSNPLATSNELIMMDWKRVKNFKLYNTYEYGKAGMLLESMQHSDFNVYSIQLNLYKYLIEVYYGYKIKEMYIVIFHPETGHKKIYVPEMGDLISKMMGHRMRDVEYMTIWAERIRYSDDMKV